MRSPRTCKKLCKTVVNLSFLPNCPWCFILSHFVTFRNSTIVYEGKAVVPTEVADALDVRYLLQGSVRRERVAIRDDLAPRKVKLANNYLRRSICYLHDGALSGRRDLRSIA